ncbi:MAG: flagellar motor protein MotB [Oscillospiraceae bacterium]|nr:flagellar motor protein MotB [Oscillospiraceae bacterium]
MRRKKSGGEGGGDSWLNTYADMVTLLLTFFAVLLSMSSVNQEKYNAFVRSFSNLPQEIIDEITNPAVDPGEVDDTLAEAAAQAMTDLYEKLNEYVKENGMDDTVSVSKKDQVIFIKFDSSVFFEPDKYIMRSGAKEVISFIGDGIKEYESMINLVSICGHTATVPDNSDSSVSDWMLSGERAAVVAKYFEDEKKMDPKKMLLLGYGKNMPIASNDDEEGRKENRRVEIVIIGEDSDISFDPYSDLREIYSMVDNSDSGSAATGTDTAKTSPTPDASGADVGNASEPPTESGGNESLSPDIQVGVSPYD